MIQKGDTVITEGFYAGMHYTYTDGIVATVKYIDGEFAMLKTKDSDKCWGSYPIEHLKKLDGKNT